MSLYDATRRDWKAFDRDQGTDPAKPPSCELCGRALGDDDECAVCDQENYLAGLDEVCGGVVEARRASAHDDANRREPWSQRVARDDRKDAA